MLRLFLCIIVFTINAFGDNSCISFNDNRINYYNYENHPELKDDKLKIEDSIISENGKYAVAINSKKNLIFIHNFINNTVTSKLINTDLIEDIDPIKLSNDGKYLLVSLRGYSSVIIQLDNFKIIYKSNDYYEFTDGFSDDGKMYYRESQTEYYKKIVTFFDIEKYKTDSSYKMTYNLNYESEIFLKITSDFLYILENNEENNFIQIVNIKNNKIEKIAIDKSLTENISFYKFRNSEAVISKKFNGIFIKALYKGNDRKGTTEVLLYIDFKNSGILGSFLNRKTAQKIIFMPENRSDNGLVRLTDNGLPIYISIDYNYNIYNEFFYNLNLTIWDIDSDQLIERESTLFNSKNYRNLSNHYWTNGIKEISIHDTFYTIKEHSSVNCIKPLQLDKSTWNTEQTCTPQNHSCFGISKANLDYLCSNPITENLEQNWNSHVSIQNELLSYDIAHLLLLKWSKPGGFNFQNDLAALLAILNSPDQFKRQEINRALQGVLHYSQELYYQLLEIYPQFKDTAVHTEDSNLNSCRTLSENNVIKKDIHFLMNILLQSILFKNNNSNYSHWTILNPLNEIMKKLPMNEWEYFVDQISESLTSHFRSTYSLDSIKSIIYNYIYSKISSIMGKLEPVKTELTYLRGRRYIQPIIISTDIINDIPNKKSEDSKVGIHLILLDDLKFENYTSDNFQKFNLKVDWTVNGKRYQGHLSAQVDDVQKEILPKGNRPDYQSMLKDHVLTGMVLIGSNHGKSILHHLYEYRLYLMNNHFTNNVNQNKSLIDLKQEVQSKIESTEIDYLIKDHHLGGGYDNVIQISKFGNIEVHEKKNASGIVLERVYLIYPVIEKNENNINITNRDFANWFKIRDQKKGGQFLLITASCLAIVPSIRLIEAVQSKNFVPIPALEYTTGIFGLDENFAESPLWDGIRKQKDYSWIRSEYDVFKTKPYNKEAKFNFQYPDEEAYTESISKNLEIMLTINLSNKEVK